MYAFVKVYGIRLDTTGHALQPAPLLIVRRGQGYPRTMSTTSSSDPDSRPIVRRSAGRPRRLTLAQILDAAIATGLDDLTMKAVAERLGVQVAVLYSYVSGREELVRLAAQRASGEAHFPIDRGQDWRAFAREYAEATFGLLDGDAQLIPIILAGNLSPSVKTDSAEQWVVAMRKRGIDATTALEMLRALDVIAMGAALLATHARAVGRDGRAYCEHVRDAVAVREAADLPMLKMNAEVYAATAAPERWRVGLDMLIEGMAARIEASVGRSQTISEP
jgi:AcrR family transcriptional regulator